MSIIAVRKYLDKIIIAADQQTTWGDSKIVGSKTATYENKSKIAKQNDLIYGIAGYCKESSFFNIFSRNHKPTAATCDGILDYLVEFKDWAFKKDNTFQFSNHYLIIFEKKIFQAIDYEVSEIKEYAAVGSGMFLALGAMYKGATPPEAVQVAKEFDLYCGGKTETITVLI